MHLPGVVDVVNEVLDNNCCVGGLNGFVVVGNNNARDGLDTTIPSLPCMTVLVSYSLLRLSARGTYLLAVDAAVISPDGEELVTSDGETVGLDMGGVAEGRSKTGDLLRRDLK